MKFKCSQCGSTSEMAGNCPKCNVPMVEEKAEEKSGNEAGTGSEATTGNQPQVGQ